MPAGLFANAISMTWLRLGFNSAGTFAWSALVVQKPIKMGSLSDRALVNNLFDVALYAGCRVVSAVVKLGLLHRYIKSDISASWPLPLDAGATTIKLYARSPQISAITAIFCNLGVNPKETVRSACTSSVGLALLRVPLS